MLDEFVTIEAHRKRYIATPVGPYLDGYLGHLRALGVARRHIYTHAQRAAVFGEYLAESGLVPGALRDEHIAAFATWYRTNPRRFGTRRSQPGGSRSIEEACRGGARRLLAYLRSIGVAPPAPARPELHPHLLAYLVFLEKHRGFARRTLEIHADRVGIFLEALRAAGNVTMEALTATDVESAAVKLSAGLGTRSHQILVSAIESFLRFERTTGRIPTTCTPFLPRRRQHALATLPAALSDAEVGRALATADRSSAMGRRDAAILQLLATYGLRASEIAGLRLEDIQWRLGTLRVRQGKVRRDLVLPLVEPVTSALIAYLRDGRPATDARHVFRKCTAPAGPLSRAVVYAVVRKALVSAGIEAKHWGPHTLRHARATSLLRRGVPLKTIGDLLGHRVPEATSLYCKLAVDDLRAVALEIPEAAR
jgi:site-specific recombinase XerD